MLADQTQNPCGSSSGSGVAVSAGFAPVAFATDTTGSVTCPAAFNALYGLRPTLGLLSRTGILPTTTSFDTAGVITKSVADIALWMDVLAQPDKKDPLTMNASVKRPKSYAANIDGNWKKWRIGVLDRKVFWNESIPLITTEKEDLEVSWPSSFCFASLLIL
jgi:amidase